MRLVHGEQPIKVVHPSLHLKNMSLHHVYVLEKELVVPASRALLLKLVTIYRYIVLFYWKGSVQMFEITNNKFDFINVNLGASNKINVNLVKIFNFKN